ncbi:MAG: hypothetical protein KME32_18425 [Mojavia pulchra JT2-VF2]|uniref:Water stress protein n=1 Tax=Mojavia pulchra JT2-VF2 TaxID=287848 RepID=A0A951Q1B2_9NOST|nr:hypothetical protein [Mojavia pulchra JT2-VF2]
MALYGYTVGDTDVSSAPGNQFQVYRFLIPPASTTAPKTITPGLVGTVTVASINNPDLEGLGTNPSTNRISAVNEPRKSGSPTIDPTVIRINNIDQPFAPASASPTRSPSDLRRFGFDSGADFGRDFSSTGQILSTNVLYTIGGSSTGTVGSSLYKITVPGTGAGTLTLVDKFGAATTVAQRQGTQPTNPGKFVDSLAIDNLNPGRTRAIAGDFSTADKDGAQLYKVDLFTGQLSAPISVKTPSGQALNVNADSGLAFTNLSGSTQRLLAFLETGAIYEITGFQDELNATGLSLGSATGSNGAGFATARLIGQVNLPNASTGATDYEGFTIVNE